MEVVKLYSELLALGVELWVEGGGLKFKQPGTLNARTLSLMKAYRDELLDLIVEIEERAALMSEHEGRLTSDFRQELPSEAIERSRAMACGVVLAHREQSKPFDWQGISFEGDPALVRYVRSLPRVESFARGLQKYFGGATLEILRAA